MNCKKKIKKILAFVCVLVISISSVTMSVPTKQVKATETVATESVEPVYLPGFKHVTLNNFYNQNYAAEKYNDIGNPVNIPEGTCAYSGHYYITNDGVTKTDSFDQTLLSLRMKCSSTGRNTRLRIFATGLEAGGLAIQKNGTGEMLVLNDTASIGVDGNNITSDATYFEPAKITTLDSFNDEFILQVSIEYGDFPKEGVASDDITGNDIRLGFYFNGEFYDFDNDGKNTDADKITILNCNMTKVGGVFSIEQSTGASVELYSVVPESKEWTSITWHDFTCQNNNVTAQAPVYLPGFRHVTLNSFYNKNYADPKYESIGNPVNIREGICTYSGHYYITKTGNFDQTLLSLRMKCSSTGTNTRLRIFATGLEAGGLAIQKNDTGEMLVLNDCAQIGDDGANIKNNATYFDPVKITTLESFNDEFILQVSIEYGDFPKEGVASDDIAGNDIRLGFYFNGEFYDFDNDGNNTDLDKIMILNCDMTKVGGVFSIEQKPNASVELYSVVPESKEYRVHMNNHWTYHLDTKKYSAISKLEATSFEANVMFTGGGSDERIYYGGKSGWNGLALCADYGGSLNLHSYSNDSPPLNYVDAPDGTVVSSDIYFQPTIAGVGSSFIDTEFKLRITTQYADYDGDGVMDAELGFFFNDALF